MKVSLISYTQNPLQVMSSFKSTILGKFKMPSEMTYKEALEDFNDTMRTNILSPCEAVHLVIHFENCTRAFMDQLVRTRTATYMAESLRFSVKTNGFDYLIPDAIRNSMQDIAEYDAIMEDIQKAYNDFIGRNIPTEDARGILPLNIIVTINMAINYRNLIGMMEQRLCSGQVQKEHRDAALMLKKLITNEVDKHLGHYLQPSCGHSGCCGWESKLDRKCKMQEVYPFRSDVIKYHKEIKDFIVSNNKK